MQHKNDNVKIKLCNKYNMLKMLVKPYKKTNANLNIIIINTKGMTDPVITGFTLIYLK